MTISTSYNPDVEDRILRILLSDERKTKVLKNLKDMLTKINRDQLSSQGRQLITVVERLLDNFYLYENNMDKMLVCIDHTNTLQVERLLSLAPDLTSSELKLCNLVTMNLDNQQIAEVFGIESASVSVKKYRIKKKLGIEKASLFNFLVRQKSIRH